MSTIAWMTRKVREIDTDLSVMWLARERKYAVVQKLYNTPSVDVMTDTVGHELQLTMSERGYTVPLPLCEALAYEQVANDAIVVRLEDRETGRPLPLDGRTVGTLREMAWKRRNYHVKDWIRAGDGRTYEADRLRQREIDDIWGYLRKDRVFVNQLSDALWGLRPTRTAGGPLPAAA